jgi:hypothetical protein
VGGVYVACTGEKRNAYEGLVEESEIERHQLEDIKIDGRKLL